MAWLCWGALVAENEEVTGVAPDGEASASLNNLLAMADDAPADPMAPPEPEPVQMADEIAGILMLLAGIAAPMFPSVAKVYSPEACQAVGAAVAPVCDKHGWLHGGIGGEYKEEFMCLAVVGPMAFATYIAANNDLEALKAAKEGEKGAKTIEGKAEPKKLPAGGFREAGSDTVTFGAPIQ